MLGVGDEEPLTQRARRWEHRGHGEEGSESRVKVPVGLRIAAFARDGKLYPFYFEFVTGVAEGGSYASNYCGRYTCN
jgi:hypothetical protein